MSQTLHASLLTSALRREVARHSTDPLFKCRKRVPCSLLNELAGENCVCSMLVDTVTVAQQRVYIVHIQNEQRAMQTRKRGSACYHVGLSHISVCRWHVTPLVLAARCAALTRVPEAICSGAACSTCPCSSAECHVQRRA